jgi:hypothetical protein
VKEGLITLKDIEGQLSPHNEYVNRELERRAEALRFVDDVQMLAEYVGARVECFGVGERWVLTKEVFPGVNIHLLYIPEDEEFSSIFKAFYSGARIKTIHGEDLCALTIAFANHILRYIKKTNPSKRLPSICDIV